MTRIFKPNTIGLKVQTPLGFKSFAGVAYMGDKETILITLSNGMSVSCSPMHKIFVSDNDYVLANNLSIGQYIMTINGLCDISSIAPTGKTEPVYDLIDVGGGHRYYTDGILSSNCQFLTADETLINAVTLLKLQGIDPMYKTNEIRWYDKIQPNKTYLVALDPSAGVGKDAAAIEVFSLPDMKQVAEWTYNRTSIPNQVRIMQNIVNFIHSEMRKFPDQRGEPDIYFTLENNSWGEAALLTIDEIGEDRFNGIMMHEPKARGVARYRKGLNTNGRSKALACTKFKSLLEADKLKIFSKSLVRQIKFFVSKGDSFAGKSGENDDCVMATLLCVRMMQMVTRWDESVGNLMREDFIDETHEDPMPISIGF